MRKAWLAVILAVAVFFILLVLAALVASSGARAPLVFGGALLTAGPPRRPAREGGALPPPPSGEPPLQPARGPEHPLDVALERYARSLGPEHIVAVHPLDRGGYGPLAASGGAAKSPGAAAPSPAKKPWSEYATWSELYDDEGALAAYFAQRAEAINNPDFDWGPVLREVGPLLAENREYIGLVNADADGRTLRVAAREISPIEAGTMESQTAFAAVPAELVRKYAERPALFVFHTHPSDPRGSPLPSSHDLSAAAFLAATGRFAASVVVSRYGVLLYTLDWSGYKAVHEAKNWNLALSSLSHDVVAAHEAIRSWSSHTLADYFAFYPRHRLLVVAWPAPEMVADGRRFAFLGNLEAPIEHGLIAEHRDDMLRHAERGRSRAEEKAPGDQLGQQLRGDLGLD